MKRKVLKIKSPVTGGKLEIRTERDVATFRGEKFPYEKTYYYCVDSGLEFADAAMEEANLKQIYNAYRHKYGIPLVEEISAMRSRYGLPSRAISLILGLGENQFGLYEEGTVPTPSVGKLLSLAMDREVFKGLLIKSQSVFSDAEYSKYYKALASAFDALEYETDALDASFFMRVTGLPVSSWFNVSVVKKSRQQSYYNNCTTAYAG